MSLTTLDTDRLAALVAAKLELVEILTRFARRQVDLIEAAEMTSLVKLLAAKQTVMNQLQLIERDLAPFRVDDPEGRVWSSPTSRAACQSQAERCNTALSELLRLEREAETAMTARRDATAVELADLETAAHAQSAYSGFSPSLAPTLQAEG
jgi:hypothetical protein